jgi:hypothetical protein
MFRTGVFVSLAFLVPGSTAVRADDAPAVKAAIDKALPLLVKGTKGHIEQRTCFACHQQGIPLLALTTARDRGFAVRAEDLREQAAFIAGFLDKNRENYRKGQGQGGQADTAGYAMLSLEWAGWDADATTNAVVEYLLQHHKNSDHWSATSNRPPSEASAFTTTYVSLRALRMWGSTDQQERITKRIDTVRAWLLKATPKDTEDRVFRLGALHAAGVRGEELQKAVRDLTKTQREDGGWGQLDKMDSDAYATGSALAFLHRAGGLATRDDVYRRGVAFLLKTQKEDGSWYVHSRSKPFQLYYESGFPHGDDQYISMAATSWAVTALALTCPEME